MIIRRLKIKVYQDYKIELTKVNKNLSLMKTFSNKI